MFQNLIYSKKGKFMDNTEEVWKTYPEYDFIEASNLGRIRSKDHYIMRKDGKKYHAKGHVLKQWLDRGGYLFVNFRVNGKKISRKVHRIIATTFIPNPKNLPQVNHIDCNRTNNVVENLEWCTCQENIAYRDKLGHTAKNNSPKKPVIAVNLEKSEVFYFKSQHEAARQLGASQANIWRVINDKRKTIGGYWFCYADENAVEKTRAKFGDKVADEVEKLIN